MLDDTLPMILGEMIVTHNMECGALIISLVTEGMRDDYNK